MNAQDDWKDPLEDNGVTLGPEEALRRETEKSKSLKVERLRLRDEIETLRKINAGLTDKIRRLEETVQGAAPFPEEKGVRGKSGLFAQPLSRVPHPSGWAVFLLIFNLCAAAAFLILLLQK
ncbi:MAG: hypothetical protein ACE5E9_02225 [Nitrospinaceae bacterium]